MFLIPFFIFIYYFCLKKGKCIYNSDENMCMCLDSISEKNCQDLNGTFIQNKNCQDDIFTNHVYCTNNVPSRSAAHHGV
jgi:hypothetical protein